MPVQPDVFQVVKDAIVELNDDLGHDSLRSIDEATPLFGGAGPLDSLSLVRLIADLEMKIEDRFAASVVLADEKAMSMGNPYRTVGALVNLITSRLAETHA